MNPNKIKASVFHGLNFIKKNLFIHTSFNFFTPKPQSIYLFPSTLCNSRCIMCLSWLKKSKDLSFNEWKNTIDNIKDWAPYIKINISGGETLFSNLMTEMINYSIKKLPYTGFTSNGFLINKQMAKILINNNFSNINISLDGNTKKTVNLIRGRSYAYTKTCSAIDFLVKEKNKQKSSTKIIVKTIIMGLNYKELLDLVKWVKHIKADGIYLQPIQPIYNSQQNFSQLKKTSLWIKLKERKAAATVFNELINMKKQGYPILNDENNLELMKEYFEIKPKKELKNSDSCFVDLESLFIFDNGKVYFCPFFFSIGNIKNNSLEKIINSNLALKQRSLIRNCPRVNTCLSTCVYKKSLLQQIKLFLFLK